jgi:hypothetical protein
LEVYALPAIHSFVCFANNEVAYLLFLSRDGSIFKRTCISESSVLSLIPRHPFIHPSQLFSLDEPLGARLDNILACEVLAA